MFSSVIVHFIPSPAVMSENNYEPFDYVPPEIDIRSLESQLQPDGAPSEDNDEDPLKINCRLWAEWRLFVLPGCFRIEQKNQKIKDVLGANLDYLVPKTKLGRQIGIMQYILCEDGTIIIEEMLYIDVILGRIDQFIPFMAGVDRYDDRGIMYFCQGIQKFLLNFISLSARERNVIINNFETVGMFSPEILYLLNHLKNLVSLPCYPISKNSPQKASVHSWPTNLSGRDLELFKLLSGLETVSPRKQALSVLNYILPEESESTSSPNDSSEPIRFEPGDKARVARLLKRYPALNHRYPYLIKMIENEISYDKFNAASDDLEHFYNGVLPSMLFFPSVLVDPPREATLWKKLFDWLVTWGRATLVFFILVLLIRILCAVFSS